MKRNYLSQASERFFTSAFIAVVSFMAMPAESNAAELKTKNQTDNIQPTVQLVGKNDSSLMFNINLDNPNGDKFTVVIVNEEGDVLYIKGYNDKNFAQQITLLKNGTSKRYIFNIWSANKSLANTYVIEPEANPLEEIVISVK